MQCSTLVDVLRSRPLALVEFRPCWNSEMLHEQKWSLPSEKWRGVGSGLIHRFTRIPPREKCVLVEDKTGIVSGALSHSVGRACSWHSLVCTRTALAMLSTRSPGATASVRLQVDVVQPTTPLRAEPRWTSAIAHGFNTQHRVCSCLCQLKAPCRTGSVSARCEPCRVRLPSTGPCVAPRVDLGCCVFSGSRCFRRPSPFWPGLTCPRRGRPSAFPRASALHRMPTPLRRLQWTSITCPGRQSDASAVAALQS